jgi:protein ImuA
MSFLNASLSPCADLPAGVWRATERATDVLQVVPSGHAVLDASLPGAGWPCGALSEVLQPPGVHLEWQLVLPALVRWQHTVAEPGQPGRSGVVLVGPPAQPCASGLQARGLSVADMVHVQPDDPVHRLWTCEQALQCAHVGAVLAWLPHAPMTALRRLQWAATRHGGLLWVFRPLAVAQQATAAVLRLELGQGERPHSLQVRVLKRRGPPLAQALHVSAPDDALNAVLAAARWRNARRRVPAAPVIQQPGSVQAAQAGTQTEPLWGTHRGAHATPAALAGVALSAV